MSHHNLSPETKAFFSAQAKNMTVGYHDITTEPFAMQRTQEIVRAEFTIGPYTFKRCPNPQLNKEWVKVFVGEEHYATFGGWPLHCGDEEIHKSAAFWVSEELLEVLAKSIKIAATGVL